MGTMQACPLYLSELAPAHLRGSINICFQLATAVGILAANCLNYGESARKLDFLLNILLAAFQVMYASAPGRLAQKYFVAGHDIEAACFSSLKIGQ